MSSPIESSPFKTPPPSPARGPATPEQQASPAKNTRTPSKYYPVQRDPSGKIKIPFSPETANAKNVVYVFKKGEKRYYGLTKQSLEERCSQHAQAAQKANTVFHKALAQSPQKFEVGIAATDSPSKLGEIEKKLIEERGSRVARGGFNMRAGGGGLRKRTPPAPPPSPERPLVVPSLIRKPPSESE